MQDEAPAAEYVPAAHCVQVDAPAADFFPAGQVAQEVAPAEDEYVPASQFVQEPFFRYCPAGQIEHDPFFNSYPLAQDVQVFPEHAVQPLGQAVQVADPSAEFIPAPQATQVALEVAPVAFEAVPAGHFEQLVFPVPDAYVPVGQVEQDEAPSAE